MPIVKDQSAGEHQIRRILTLIEDEVTVIVILVAADDELGHHMALLGDRLADP